MIKLYIQARERLLNLRKDVEGASLIEYSLLIGLITAAVVALIVIMGGRIVNYWQALVDATA